MTPGEVVRLKRRSMGMSQHALGVAIGYTGPNAKQMICNFEKNQRPIPSVRIKPLAKALNVSISMLLP